MKFCPLENSDSIASLGQRPLVYAIRGRAFLSRADAGLNHRLETSRIAYDFPPSVGVLTRLLGLPRRRAAGADEQEEHERRAGHPLANRRRRFHCAQRSSLRLRLIHLQFAERERGWLSAFNFVPRSNAHAVHHKKATRPLTKEQTSLQVYFTVLSHLDSRENFQLLFPISFSFDILYLLLARISEEEGAFTY